VRDAGKVRSINADSRGGTRMKFEAETGSAGKAPAILLACGNELRRDDGVGLEIARAAEQTFPNTRLRIVAMQQWTPELVEEIAGTALAIFVDACVDDEPGGIRVRPLKASNKPADTHRPEPAGLLGLAQQVCGHAPARAFAVTVGAESFQYGEGISGRVRQAVPRVLRLLENLVTAFSAEGQGRAAA
jgi:hydrogenase maturation protease